MERGPWDVIDLDAYANPWILLRQALRLQPARDLVVTATCTQERAMRTGGCDFAYALAGTGKLTPEMYHEAVPLYRWYDDVIRWAMQWCQAGTKVRAEECRRIHSRAAVSCTRYYAIRYRA